MCLSQKFGIRGERHVSPLLGVAAWRGSPGKQAWFALIDRLMTVGKPLADTWIIWNVYSAGNVYTGFKETV